VTQTTRQGERIRNRVSDGPVIACIADGGSGRAVARIAAALAGRLEAPLMLATVQQCASSEITAPVLGVSVRLGSVASRLAVSAAQPVLVVPAPFDRLVGECSPTRPHGDRGASGEPV
jgi:hypothetical protein